MMTSGMHRRHFEGRHLVFLNNCGIGSQEVFVLVSTRYNIFFYFHSLKNFRFNVFLIIHLQGGNFYPIAAYNPGTQGTPSGGAFLPALAPTGPPMVGGGAPYYAAPPPLPPTTMPAAPLHHQQPVSVPFKLN